MDIQPSESINLPFLTLFIPAYNRAYSLGKTLESVEKITSRDFEVIIVDDGSIDNTREIVDSWSARVSFPTRYFHQENSGKAGAHNSALEIARGVLFMTLDAGDLILPDAVEKIRAEWQTIPEGETNIAGIGALCLHENGKITGKHFPEGGVIANYLEMITYTGEKRQAILTSVMRQYPYPQIPGEKHFRPDLILKRMAHDYWLRFVNIPVQINVREKDGITANIRKYRMDNPGGFRLYHLEDITLHKRYFSRRKLFGDYWRFIRFSLHAGTGLQTQATEVPSRFLWFLAVPKGISTWAMDNLRKQFE